MAVRKVKKTKTTQKKNPKKTGQNTNTKKNTEKKKKVTRKVTTKKKSSEVIKSKKTTTSKTRSKTPKKNQNKTLKKKTGRSTKSIAQQSSVFVEIEPLTTAEEMAALLANEEPRKKNRRFSFVSSKSVPETTETQPKGGNIVTKQRKKAVKAAMIGLGLFIIAAIYTIQFHLRSSVAKDSGSIETSGIIENAMIKRDIYGIAIVEASNEEDLFYAAGYAHASDRLWQMVSLSYVAQGRISEIKSSEAALNLDVFMRSLNIKKHVQKALGSMPANIKAKLKRFADGVNFYLENENLPVEFMLTGFEPNKWHPIDTLYIFAIMNLSLSHNIEEEVIFLRLLKKLGPQRAARLVPIYEDEPLPMTEVNKVMLAHKSIIENDIASPPFEMIEKYLSIGMPASNNWAITPARAKGKKSIVVNDTHLKLQNPNAWYILHLKCPTYDVAGVTLAGMPFIALGFNGSIAWGATMVMADSQDLYLEKLKKEKNQTLYLSPKGVWRPVVRRVEEFKVDGEIKKIEILETENGPLLNGALNKKKTNRLMPSAIKSQLGLSLKSALFDGERAARGIYMLGKAKTMTEARRAMSFFDSIYLNIVYGDANNIGWQVTGKYPRRINTTGQLPSPGWMPEYQWQGYHSYESNPAMINPPRGYIVTANHRTVPKEHPIVLTKSWHSPERAQRLSQLLDALPQATALDMMNMHKDRVSIFAQKIIRQLKAPVVRQGILSAAWSLKKEDRALLKEALKDLNSFDGDMRAVSKPAAIFSNFMYHFIVNVFADEVDGKDSELYDVLMKASQSSYNAFHDHLLKIEDSPFYDNVTTKDVKETRSLMLAKSLVDAIKHCEEKMGKNRKTWQWGKIHTLNRGSHKWVKSFDIYNVPAMRLIVDFSKEDPAYLLIHPGNSGNRFSKHYDNMIESFLRVDNHTLPFKKENIKNQYTKILRLMKRKNK